MVKFVTGQQLTITMGLSFHYKGALRRPESLKTMIEEVVDIAKTNQWEHQVFEETFPNNTLTVDSYADVIYGICFSPPKCEPVCLTFLSNGELYHFWNIEQLKDSKIDFENQYMSVKTQFAGPRIHMQLINLFDYLNKKYFENFDLTDDGNYWESRNQQLLEDTFEKHTNLIEGFNSLLESIPMKENESVEEYLIRMVELFQKNKGDNTEEAES